MRRTAAKGRRRTRGAGRGDLQRLPPGSRRKKAPADARELRAAKTWPAATDGGAPATTGASYPKVTSCDSTKGGQGLPSSRLERVNCSGAVVSAVRLSLVHGGNQREKPKCHRVSG